ncbi:MAG: hypothetical protein Q8M65_03610, partial [Rhodoglobus sp.]|nr:hypothetical protein [Rhodoglobus sp.]
MADHPIIVDQSAAGVNGACPAADDGKIPGIIVAVPVALGLAETITTDEAASAVALPASGIKSPGYRRWIANLWTGAASVAAGVMDEVV